MRVHCTQKFADDNVVSHCNGVTRENASFSEAQKTIQLVPKRDKKQDQNQ